MGSAVRLSLLGLLLWLQLGRSPARSPRTADQVSEADIQRLLHGVMEQLGIARPRVEYPAHQATNIVGPQSIQGKLGAFLTIKNPIIMSTSYNMTKNLIFLQAETKGKRKTNKQNVLISTTILNGYRFVLFGSIQILNTNNIVDHFWGYAEIN